MLDPAIGIYHEKQNKNARRHGQPKYAPQFRDMRFRDGVSKKKKLTKFLFLFSF
jgi:hypothetical protein